MKITQNNNLFKINFMRNIYSKIIVFVLAIGLLQVQKSNAQGECLSGGCTITTTQYPATTQTTTSSTFVVVATDIYGGEYAVYNVTSGSTYEWSLLTADGGNATYDSQLTLFNGSTDAQLCYSDDYSGDDAKISWTATYTGTVKVLVSQYNCATNSVNSTLVWRRASGSTINDASVEVVYTMGTIAIPASNPHVVTARITNQGTTSFSNLVVTMNVTGANTFTNTQTIFLLPAGTSVTVSFTGYSPANTGVNTVTVSIPTDNNNSNNIQVVTQNVNTSSFNYAYLAPTVSNGAGFNSNTGEVAVKFNAGSSIGITQVKTYFNTAGAGYRIKIYDATGAGSTPGTLLYTSGNLVTATGVSTINLGTTITLAGTFFVSLEQTTTTNFSMGYEDEIPMRSGVFYYSSPTGSAWEDLASGGNFRIMLEPVFSCSVPTTTANPANSTICATQSTSFSVSATGATSYQWQVNTGSGFTNITNGGVYSNATTATLNITGATAGMNNYQYRVIVTNSCGNVTSSSALLTINIVSTVVTLSSPSNGATGVAYSPANFSWNASATATSYLIQISTVSNFASTVTSGTPSTNSFSTSALSPNTLYYWRVRAVNSCGNGSFSTVFSFTTANGGTQTITSVTMPLSNLCGGQRINVNYTVGASYNSGNIFHVEYSSDGGTTWNISNSLQSTTSGTINIGVPNTAGSIDLQFKVRATNPANESSIYIAYSTIGKAQEFLTVTGNQNICTGITESYSSTTDTYATQYSWGNPTNTTITAGAGTTNINLVASSSFSSGVLYTLPQNTCGSGNRRIASVNVNSPFTIAYTAGSSVNFGSQNINSTSGNLAYILDGSSSYQGCSSYTAGSLTNRIALIDRGTCNFSWKAYNAQQAGAIAVLIVNNVDNTTTNMTEGNYGQEVTIPVVFIGMNDGQVIKNSIGSGNTVNVTFVPDGLSITNNSPATPGTITGATTLCSGATQTYSIASVSGATGYTWTAPAGATINSGQGTNSVSIIWGSTGGTLSVTANNASCASAAQNATITVTATPAQPGTVSGTAAVCAGSTQTYSISAVSGATGYTWTVPTGATINSGQGTTSISVTFGSTSGNVGVVASNSCGNSSIRNRAITVNNIPAQPSAISGNTTVCSGASNTYSVSTVSGATSYTWTLPSGWSGTSTTNIITISAGTSSGNISVTANNSCGSSTISTSSITVNSAPAQPGTIAGATSACNNSTQTFSISAVSGATGYTWTVPSGATINSGQGTTSINATMGTSSGNVSVTASNSCGTSAARAMSITITTSVTPSVSISITSGSNPSCSGNSITFTASPSNGGTSPQYQWKINGNNAGSNSATFSSSTINNNDQITCVLTSNDACASTTTATSNTITVNVVGVPSQPSTISGSTTVCSGASNTYSVSTVSGVTSYTWTLPSGWSGTSTTNSITASAGTSSGNITVTANNSCGSSTSQSLAVTSNSVVTPSVSISGNNTICGGISVTFVATANNGGTSPSYQWKVNGSNVGSNSPAYVNSSLTNNDVVTCILTSSETCVTSSTATSNSITMNVTTPLTVSVSISGNTTICSGTSVTFVATANNGGTSPIYQWKVNGSNVGSNSPAYATNSLQNGDVVSCVLTSSETCISGNNISSNSLTMTVNSTETASVNITTGGGSTICPGEVVVFTATTTNAGSSPIYQWKLNGNNVGSNSNSYVNTSIANGDVVNCILTSNANCVSGSPATSNSITITVSSTVTAAVSVVADDDSICIGTNITFTASANGGGTSPSYQWKLNGNNVGSNSNTYSNSGLLNGDVIQVVMTSSSSCATGSPATSNNVTITASSPIIPTINQSGNTLSSSVNSSIYIWYFNGNFLNTSTTNGLTITQAGNYAVEIDNGLGCFGTSAQFNASLVGLNKTEFANNILQVSPNPSEGIFVINAMFENQDQIKVIVLNNMGQEVYNKLKEVTDNKVSHEIDLTVMPAGTYFLIVTGKELRTTNKLIITK
jgi:hypothetical protein